MMSNSTKPTIHEKHGDNEKESVPSTCYSLDSRKLQPLLPGLRSRRLSLLLLFSEVQLYTCYREFTQSFLKTAQSFAQSCRYSLDRNIGIRVGMVAAFNSNKVQMVKQSSAEPDVPE